jgi:hypothetical protein
VHVGGTHVRVIGTILRLAAMSRPKHIPPFDLKSQVRRRVGLPTPILGPQQIFQALRISQR